MIPTTIEKYLNNQLGSPRVITSTAQLEDYVCALAELDRQNWLTVDERNFAELLILLIEAYVEKPCYRRFSSPAEILAELLSTNELLRNN